MEISTQKSAFMVNSTNNTSAGICMKGEKLEEVTLFEYFGALQSKDGISTADVRMRLPWRPQLWQG
ncbi:hypothetical protein DPMN_113753 [Dreissena polymorpha]|uniref:Uncharacterized protein n=1 Tax=Dreissena polymorpha TaxID=45954 RepID=A0A9D4KIK6_DREPO|nr:hypothetical protein DPMN_113753 [Dreissena polymorpha]